MLTQYKSSTHDIFQYKGEELTELQLNGVTIWNGSLDYLEFTELDDGTYSVKAKDVATIPSNLIIPSSYKGKSVTVIEKDGFKNAISLINIIIPDSVITIYAMAFYNCSNLKSVTIPDSVTKIYQYAFSNCSNLVTAIIPVNVTTMNYSVFGSSPNLSIYYKGNAQPDSWVSGWNGNRPVYYYSKTKPTTTGNYWHYVDGEPAIWENSCEEGHTWTPWSTIVLPGCTEEGMNRRECSSCGAYETEILRARGHTPSDWIIDIEATTTSVGSKHKECTRCGITLETKTIPIINSGLTFSLMRDGTYSVGAKDDNVSGEITIPSTYSGVPVTRIADGGFSYCEDLTRVKFAEGSNLHTIGVSAFMYCANLEGIDIPDSVGYIQMCAFAYCDKLKYINVSENSELDSIGAQAFMECYNLVDITNLLANVTGIYNETFQGCSKLPNVTLAPDLDEIGARAFDACYGFTGIHIPANVFFIGEDAFRSCHNVETITVDADNITYHSKNNCLIETETNTVILGCRNSEIPRTVSHIGGGAFCAGTYFAPIRIPLSVKTINPLAFKDCENLTIYCEAESKPADWADNWNDGSATVVWGYADGKDVTIYYGVAEIPESYNSAFILGLENKTAANEHLSSIIATPLEDQYIYYCAPTSYGDCTFSYNNFVGGFSKIVEGIGFTNAGGVTELYNIYKSNQANLGVSGAITITIQGMG